MTKEQKKELFEIKKNKMEIIKQILNENDPMGLISVGCPDDEYTQEANLIEASMRDVGDLNDTDLSDIIANVFLKQFDEILDKTVCKKIAREINKKLSN